MTDKDSHADSSLDIPEPTSTITRSSGEIQRIRVELNALSNRVRQFFADNRAEKGAVMKGEKDERTLTSLR